MLYLDSGEQCDTVTLVKSASLYTSRPVCDNRSGNNRQKTLTRNSGSATREAVTIGVFEGSVLAPALFAVCNDSVNVALNNCITKFTKATGIGNSFISQQDRVSHQQYRWRFASHAGKWEMPFRVNKCEFLF